MPGERSSSRHARQSQPRTEGRIRKPGASPEIAAYSNTTPYPRAIQTTLSAEKLFSFSADYTMPLFYPDLAAGSLFYLKTDQGVTLSMTVATGTGAHLILTARLSTEGLQRFQLIWRRAAG
ncbi:MAG: hypothetical protein MZV63_31625 [Marinilabiliales bacterium]|nr:hypothetical protein [Marinilabiliales bacterium]